MKRNNRTKIALILVAVLAVAAVGMIAYGFYRDVKAGKGIDAGHAARAALVLASIVISVVKIVNGKGGQRRSPEMYRKEYGFIIGNSFTDDKKREKAFFSALDMYNDDCFSAAVKTLNKLKKDTYKWNERCAIDFFLALCYQDMGALTEAAESYEAVLATTENSTAASNLGLCYQHLGEGKKAERAYEIAMRADPKNPYPPNNLAQLLIRGGEYERALEYAKKATELKDNMYQAYNALAVCYAMLGRHGEYREALEKAAANGSDRRAIEEYVRNLGADVG
jgi:tetratricopeptide (TPR) repeat protein